MSVLVALAAVVVAAVRTARPRPESPRSVTVRLMMQPLTNDRNAAELDQQKSQ